MNFRRGQKVVCVKASRDLIKGKIYTISSCIGDEAVTVKEVKPTDGCIGFYKWRFKPAKDEWAEKILEDIMEEIKVGVLESETLNLNINSN